MHDCSHTPECKTPYECLQKQNLELGGTVIEAIKWVRDLSHELTELREQIADQDRRRELDGIEMRDLEHTRRGDL